MFTNKNEYIAHCQKESQEFLKTHKYLLRYVKNPHGHKVGVVLIALLDNTEGKSMLFFGWSKCHVGLDVFNKWIGVYKAIQRLQDPLAVLPRSFEEEFNNLVARSRRYFKQVSFEG